MCEGLSKCVGLVKTAGDLKTQNRILVNIIDFIDFLDEDFFEKIFCEL
jgi:hypothetical protein